MRLERQTLGQVKFFFQCSILMDQFRLLYINVSVFNFICIGSTTARNYLFLSPYAPDLVLIDFLL